MNSLHNKIKEFFPFFKFRNHQENTIKDIFDTYQSGKNHYILEAPTGFGKSAIAFTAARIINQNIKKNIGKVGYPPITICTKTRLLQNQYFKSFSKYNISRLWSASHYRCEMYPNDDDFYYGSLLCPGKENCHRSSKCKYLLAKNRFFSSEVGILNYHYFLYSKDVDSSVLILDEAHNIENILCSIMEVKISLKDIQKLCEILNTMNIQYNRSDLVTSCKNVTYSKKLDKMSISSFFEQIKNINRIINDKKKDVLCDNNISKYLLMAKGLGRCLKITEKLIEKINKYLNSKVEWIVSQNQENTVIIKPLDIVEQTGILSESDFTILMSATICDHKQLCKGINIDNDNCTFKSIPSEIPIENRKVYEVNVGSINSRNKKELFPSFVKTIDNIIKNVGNVRGIIHSVSYANANQIIQMSKYSDRMIIPDNLLSVEEILLSKENTILVSPSIMEGVDLKDNISRFQIFFKIPYAYLGDKWVKTKMERNYKWYIRNAAIKLVQGSGRSIRSKEDYAETFILDSNFKKIKCMLPKWYMEAVEEL